MIGIDSGYCKEMPFLDAHDDLGETIVADVAKDLRIYLEEPKTYLPERISSRGRRPTRLTCVVVPSRMVLRHRQRQSSIDSAYDAQRARGVI